LLQHGLSKVFGFPVPGPSLSGLLIVAAFLETLGSLLLLVGAYTRIVAFILSGEMAFAYFMAHAPRSFYPLANGGEGAILFGFVFLYLVFAGGGPWSIDRAVLKQDTGQTAFVPFRSWGHAIIPRVQAQSDRGAAASS
jgi:putative oxidoreductase